MATAAEAEEATEAQPERVASHEWAAGCLACASTAMFALGVGLLAWWSHPFTTTAQSEVVSWVTQNDYPISQEPIAYIGALVCVALGVWAGHAIWLGTAQRLARDAGLSLRSALRLVALGLSGFGTAGLSIISGAWGFGSLIALPCLAAVLSASLAWRWRHRIQASGSARTHTPASKSAMGSAPSPRVHRFVTPAAITAGAVLLYAFLYDAGLIFLVPIDTLHEGERLAHLTILEHGGVPYRDFFVQHGLGQDVFKPWLASVVHDGTLSALRLTESAIRPIGALSLYLLALSLHRSWITAALLVLLLTTGELALHDRLAFGLLAIAALARGLRIDARAAGNQPRMSARATRGWLLASGLLTAAAFLYSTEVGLYAGAGCGGTLVLLALQTRGVSPAERATPLCIYAIGFAAGLTPLLAYLGAYGAIGDFIQNTRLQIGMQRTVWGLPFPPIDDVLRGARSFEGARELLFGRAFRFYAPVLILLGWTGAVVRRACLGPFPRDGRWPIAMLVLLFGIASFASALGRSDDRHLTFAMAPAYALLLLAFETWVYSAFRKTDHGMRIRAALPVAFAITVFAAWWLAVNPPADRHLTRIERVATGQTLPTDGRHLVWAPLGRMGASPAQLTYLKTVTESIQAHTEPGQPFYDFTNQAAFHYFANRPSASRYVFVAYAATPALQHAVIEELEERRPRLVLYGAGHDTSQLDGIPASKRHPLIDAYLRSHYAPAGKPGGAQILLRRGEHPVE